MALLVLVRHGTTLWNKQDLFAGWGDAPLSPTGEAQALALGQFLASKRFEFDICHTSRLKRSIRTLEIMLEGMGNPDIPTERFWRLNERHYGALQEKSRKAVAEQYGHQSTIAWRRSYRARPPALTDDDPRWLEQRERFSDVPEELLPRTESLEDGVLRVEPYWQESLAPRMREGKNVLVVAHTCSMRGLVRILDGLSDEETEAFRVPTALPLVYELDNELTCLSSYRLHANVKSRWRALRSRCKPTWISWM
jgi:2,3-bisphosphoglycerate-dependent phosphoglycerate mutase